MQHMASGVAYGVRDVRRSQQLSDREPYYSFVVVVKRRPLSIVFQLFVQEHANTSGQHGGLD